MAQGNHAGQTPGRAQQVPACSSVERYHAALRCYTHGAFDDVLRTLSPLFAAFSGLALEVRVAALNLAAAASLALDRPEHALAHWQSAVTLKPDYAEAHSNLGVVLRRLGRFEEAAQACHIALGHRPDYASAWNNLANALGDLRRHAEAESAWRQAIALRPDYPDARYNLAQCLLAAGRFEEAWPLHEARYDARLSDRNAFAPPLALPQWQGEPLAGKSLLVWTEQGYGDLIQFGRFLAPLKVSGARRVTLACASALHALFDGAPGIDAVTHEQAVTDPSAFDYWTFALSVPLHLGTTAQTIAPAVWLKAPATRVATWREPIARLDGLRVGLVWKGNPAHKNDANRSLPALETLAPLWDVAGVRFVSLQKGHGEDEARHAPTHLPMLHLGSALGDFADTAAVLDQLDLLICVDTAIAHLAAALGKPCWVLLPGIGTDWRWQREGHESIWYPGTLRLFRQRAGGDWAEAIAEVRDALAKRVAA
ncbi:tetratricopeptide repeat protein [Paraburkholderia oxyphila]|uniref:tetratricopeptide repeat protein n=1 Tax=Paraburkholderia oxyphila TaxID=614212 RepID=UPI00069336A3|nr:tetratricopeptide repeat-containing glycosyltransferase family protein [Paraburkholderia oxyphila]